MKISIIMPTHNKIQRLKLCLKSISMVSYPKNDYEVIIIDDGSSDGTKEFLQNYCPNFDLKVIHIQNSGRAAARNRGIQSAKYDLLLFMDDDVLFERNTLSEHVDKQEQQKSIVHGKILNLPYLKFFMDPSKGIYWPDLNLHNKQKGQLKDYYITENDIEFMFNDKIVSQSKTTLLEETTKEILSQGGNFKWIGFTGSNTSVCRQWVEEVSGFDSNYGRLWGCEDVDLGYRLYKKGKAFMYLETAKIYHMTHYRSDFKEQHFQTAEYFYSKYKDDNIRIFHKFVNGEISREQFLAYVF